MPNKKTREVNHEEPIAECNCCGHLIYYKSSIHPNGIKKGSAIPKNCPECNCPDVRPYTGKGEEPDEPEEIELSSKIDIDDEDVDLYDEDDLL